MKLYLTLDNEKGNKLEREYSLEGIEDEDSGGYLIDTVRSMIDTFDKVDVENKEEELVNEAKRLTVNND